MLNEVCGQFNAVGGASGNEASPLPESCKIKAPPVRLLDGCQTLRLLHPDLRLTPSRARVSSMSAADGLPEGFTNTTGAQDWTEVRIHTQVKGRHTAQ